MTNQGAGSAEKFFSLANEYLRAGQDRKSGRSSGHHQEKHAGGAAGIRIRIGGGPTCGSVSEIDSAWPNSGAPCTANSTGRRNTSTPWFCCLTCTWRTISFPGACESLEKLVEIDPYDSRNQQRMDLLQGRADDAFLSRLKIPADQRRDARVANSRAGKYPAARAASLRRSCSKMFTRGRHWRISWSRRRFLFSTRCSPRPSSGCKESWNCFPGKKSTMSGCKAFSRPRTGGPRKARASPSRNVRERWWKSRQIAPPPMPRRRCATLQKSRKSIKTFSASRRRAPCFRSPSMRWAIICARRGVWRSSARRDSRRKWLRSFALRASRPPREATSSG